MATIQTALRVIQMTTKIRWLAFWQRDDGRRPGLRRRHDRPELADARRVGLVVVVDELLQRPFGLAPPPRAVLELRQVELVRDVRLERQFREDGRADPGVARGVEHLLLAQGAARPVGHGELLALPELLEAEDGLGERREAYRGDDGPS